MTVTIYGIKACDTMKKAQAWLAEHGVQTVFHNYKSRGIDEHTLRAWIAELGWETVLNRAGTTFRKLPEDVRATVDAERAVALMLAQPSMIKRPVLDIDGRLVAGFKPEVYARLF